MNTKKFLKKESEKDLQSIQTDKDNELLQRLELFVEEENRSRSKRNGNKFVWAIPSAVVACAVAAVLLIELVPFANNNLDDNYYDESNFVQVESDFAELSGALKNLMLNLSEENVSTVKRYYDSVSGDDLYYSLNVNVANIEVYYSLELMIVVNQKYDYKDFETDSSFVSETYPDFSINYKQQIALAPDTGINLIQCQAKIESEKYDIFVFRYEEYSLGNGKFLYVMDDILKFDK